MKNIKYKSLIILDFGSQYTQLIARRIREIGVYCEIYSYQVGDDVLKDGVCGIILSGGPSTVTAHNPPRAPQWVFLCGLPVLGICYGMQTMASQLGGEVLSANLCEYGYAEVRVSKKNLLLSNIADGTTKSGEAILDVWMSHGDQVAKLPDGFKVICTTDNAPIAGMAHEERHWYGLQFHPEVTHTLQGLVILQRFVIEICQANTNWKCDDIIDQIIDSVREQVGEDHVLLALSGGVDSSVLAALLDKAIGAQLICIFVDTGLLREGEKEQVLSTFKTHMGIKIISVAAQRKFLSALAGVTCPEKKRKIVGHLFIELFEQAASKLQNVKWLAQGTIYPDVIESSTQENSSSQVIKSHHNVGGLPPTLKLSLLEPLRELFKDEVRHIGLKLGLPASLVYRHPFPGPGLAVRILGEVKKEFVLMLRKADSIFIEELQASGLYSKVSQAFAVFLPIKSVGVMGDGRRYDYVICLRAVNTNDFMTAQWAHLPWDFLGKISRRIVNEVPGVSRVTYDISDKPPATIEWE